MNDHTLKLLVIAKELRRELAAADDAYSIASEALDAARDKYHAAHAAYIAADEAFIAARKVQS
jgi:hypothetical protein